MADDLSADFLRLLAIMQAAESVAFARDGDANGRHLEIPTHDFYVAGSEAMVAATLLRLTDMQVPSTRIQYDAFTGG